MMGMKFVGLVFVLLVQAAKPAPPADLPAGPGVFCRQDASPWVRLEPAVITDTQSKGMDLFLQTGGFYNPDLTLVYKGPRARLQLSALRPVFFVRGAGSARDAAIVALTRRKDTRTLQTSAAAVTVDNKVGISRKHLRRTALTVYSDDSFTVSPDEDLKPGEYVLLLGLSNAGFDFGIRPEKGK